MRVVHAPALGWRSYLMHSCLLCVENGHFPLIGEVADRLKGEGMVLRLSVVQSFHPVLYSE
jgi:hypothetical protein